MYPLIAIVGPTASGKSALGLDLAGRIGGEIINYDSVQVYRGFDIGSAKPSLEERRKIPHHLIDIRQPDQVFTAGDFQREARAAIDDVRSRQRVPILVGGTGLYLRAALEGLFDGPQRSAELRQRLEAIAERRGREHVHALLGRLDPVAASRIATRDLPKTIRALEVRIVTGESLSRHLERQARRPLEGFEFIVIGLSPLRQDLYERIDLRVMRMFDAGLVEEVVSLLAAGVPRHAKPFESIGYSHVLAYLDGRWRLEDAVDAARRDTRRYAKRQWTWFRKQFGVRWFDGPGESDEISQEVYRWVRSFVSMEAFPFSA